MQKDEFIEQNLPLVHFIVRRFRSRAAVTNVDLDDLFQVGCMGLIKAANKFEPERGFQFSTYAVPMIIGEILRYFREHRPIFIPRTEQELAGKILKYQLETKSAAEIAEFLGCSIKLAARALKSLTLQLLSTDRPILQSKGAKEISVMDTIPLHEDFSKVELSEFIQSLSDREQQVARSTLAGSTQCEIGELIGKSQVQVWRSLQSIREKLSQYMETS